MGVIGFSSRSVMVARVLGDVFGTGMLGSGDQRMTFEQRLKKYESLRQRCDARPTSLEGAPSYGANSHPALISSSALPAIVDVEASGFGRGSYPIEIAIALPQGAIESRLVKPLPEWTHWTEEAEALHGISRDQLLREGTEVEEVALWLNKCLQLIGLAYSDSWGYDSSWIARLYNDSGTVQRFRLDSLRSILTQHQLECWDTVRAAVQHNDEIRRHRAGDDVRMLQKTFALTRM